MKSFGMIEDCGKKKILFHVLRAKRRRKWVSFAGSWARIEERIVRQVPRSANDRWGRLRFSGRVGGGGTSSRCHEDQTPRSIIFAGG